MANNLCLPHALTRDPTSCQQIRSLRMNRLRGKNQISAAFLRENNKANYCRMKWLRGKDLNLRPLGYEPNVQVGQVMGLSFVCGTKGSVAVKTAHPIAHPQTYFWCFI